MAAASGPPAPCTHVSFCTAGSAPRAGEHAPDTAPLQGQDSHQTPPLPLGSRCGPATGAGEPAACTQEPGEGPHKEASPGSLPAAQSSCGSPHTQQVLGSRRQMRTDRPGPAQKSFRKRTRPESHRPSGLLCRGDSGRGQHSAGTGEGRGAQSHMGATSDRGQPLPSAQVTKLGRSEGGDLPRSSPQLAANQNNKPLSAWTLRGSEAHGSDNSDDEVTSVALIRGFTWSLQPLPKQGRKRSPRNGLSRVSRTTGSSEASTLHPGPTPPVPGWEGGAWLEASEKGPLSRGQALPGTVHPPLHSAPAWGRRAGGCRFPPPQASGPARCMAKEVSRCPEEGGREGISVPNQVPRPAQGTGREAGRPVRLTHFPGLGWGPCPCRYLDTT